MKALLCIVAPFAQTHNETLVWCSVSLRYFLVIISLKFGHIHFLTWALHHVNHIHSVAVDEHFDSDKKPHCDLIQVAFTGQAPLFNSLQCISCRQTFLRQFSMSDSMPSDMSWRTFVLRLQLNTIFIIH